MSPFLFTCEDVSFLGSLSGLSSPHGDIRRLVNVLTVAYELVQKG